MRTSSALILPLLLGGCGQATPDGNVSAKIAAGARAEAADAGGILCALAGSDTFQRQCTLDRTETAEGVVLTVREPDGGFHRLRVVSDGRGVVAADGAEEAKVAVLGTDGIEVSIGGARYRLPAHVGPLPRS